MPDRIAHSLPVAGTTAVVADAGRSPAARAGIGLLAVAAGVNLAAGVVLAFRDPRRASDLWMMVDWCKAWLIDGTSLYTVPGSTVDYPPNAIVLLSPLALVPRGWVVPLWTAGAILLTPVLPWLVLRAASDGQRDKPALVMAVLLYLCWAAPRTLLQFSLLSMTLAWAAFLIVDTRWIAGGVALGLALFKPHIAGPVALWMLVTGRLRSLAAAAVVVLLGGAVYDARIGESPLTTTIGWVRAIRLEYGGADGLVGHTSLRDWAQRLAVGPAMADALWIVASAGLLLAICAVALRQRSCAVNREEVAIPAMFSLWSLLAVYHNGNNMILVLPAFGFWWLRSIHSSSPSRWIPIVVLQAALAFDVPVRLSGLNIGPGWGRTVIDQFDRLIVLATLALVLVEWSRQNSRAATDCARR